MTPLRLLWLEQVVLRWWKWAMREIDKTHPDVGWILLRIRQIEDQLDHRGRARLGR
jgi:hypothetical protein